MATTTYAAPRGTYVEADKRPAICPFCWAPAVLVTTEQGRVISRCPRGHRCCTRCGDSVRRCTGC